MIIAWDKIQIYVKPGVTDLRNHINGLSAAVEEECGDKLFSGSLFLFCNRNRKRLKILYWDRNGFCLWVKRLEEDRFPWPKDSGEAKEITREQLAMLLDGIDFFKAHKKLNFSQVS
jgi:transposase